MVLGCGSAERLCQDAERCGQVAAQRRVAISFQVLVRSIAQGLGCGVLGYFGFLGLGGFMRIYEVVGCN